ncbi:TPA: hypothetical protein ACF5BV_004762 [Vibrio parahaemolyticus]|uniref:hypothetical protein n=1 Tax=Vibrio parahaemolyticus TaxID=670 RepID=UPI00111D84CC|nr:hypothetical protein [Vibrio parahaemolyticus]EGR0400044.1 hypothetical protein [Vibrio parahaemolyticus]EKB1972882.1 hypothetical protein [Vibrio parahaemolyticus]MBE4008596.1 hypothetical protein [Vibrio parahaemolyticus]MCI9720643.1 hypothetical protein [Vibrio parahaemolyticus]TNZ65184.1 hypothetical protein CGK43_24730 [Vibrio parahaemolyticus]
MTNEAKEQELNVEVTAKKDELSLKAKGAGLLVLIAICLVGIVLVALKMADSENMTVLFLPLFFLSYITNNLIATLDATLGLTVRHHD